MYSNYLYPVINTPNEKTSLSGNLIEISSALAECSRRHTLEIEKRYTKMSVHIFINLMAKLIVTFCPVKPFLKRS